MRIALFALVLVAGGARAQSSEVFPVQAAAARAGALEEIVVRVDPEQRAAVEAFAAGGQGAGNLALVQQHGDANALHVTQIGQGNLAVLAQVGARNRTEIEQLGHGNVFGAWLTGDDNRVRVQQHGDNNAYVLDFQGDRLDHTVRQHGDGLQAVQVGQAHRPVSIEQRGTGMEVIVRHH